MVFCQFEEHTQTINRLANVPSTHILQRQVGWSVVISAYGRKQSPYGCGVSPRWLLFPMKNDITKAPDAGSSIAGGQEE